VSTILDSGRPHAPPAQTSIPHAMRLEVDFRRRMTARDRTVTLDVRFTSTVDRLVLFGPSGAGKTLTLLAIAGLVAPDEGRIVCDEEVWNDSARGIAMPARKRRVGLVFQDYALFPHLNVHDNVAAVHRRGFPRALSVEQRGDVEGLLEAFGLMPVRESYPAQISGGQRQRTALARALAGSPRMLLLDEPFSALDEPLRRAARDELASVQARRGIPVVLITHDPRDIDAFAQDVVALEDGRVVAR